MNVQELQKVIDEKRLDPTKLSKDQAAVIDKAFKDGTLKGYKGVGELARERLKGREELAKKSEEDDISNKEIDTSSEDNSKDKNTETDDHINDDINKTKILGVYSIEDQLINNSEEKFVIKNNMMPGQIKRGRARGYSRNLTAKRF